MCVYVCRIIALQHLRHFRYILELEEQSKELRANLTASRDELSSLQEKYAILNQSASQQRIRLDQAEENALR